MARLDAPGVTDSGGRADLGERCPNSSILRPTDVHPHSRTARETLLLVIDRATSPKGADLRTFIQADLEAIAHELNHRLREIHGYRTPAEVYADLLNSGDALTA
ncbi:hypothetical protein [Streptomyces sp. NPDC101150]|uniref:hypothetical protein n=1 Tax=Streptomyces sp. NPDC101150 TaxID=3366114 RepID=UPI0037F232C3